MKVYKEGDFILNNYEVFQCKRGGMGVVYICLDHEYDVPVAIKSILPKYFKNEIVKKLFKQELLNWVELGKHPNIVQAHYIREIDYFPAIFMEVIIGDEQIGNSLYDYIHKYRFSTEESLKLAIQFCNGMIYAQNTFREMNKTFVHCDLKPSNILITQEMIPKITDFGLVKTEYGDKKSGGTFGYMSPEQFRGELFDTRTDIYSFGCIFYEMLCNGKMPYELDKEDLGNSNHSPREVILQQKHLSDLPIDPDPFIPESKIKKNLRDLLLKCLEKDKNNRYSDFIELLDIFNYLYFELTGKIPSSLDKPSLDANDWSGRAMAYAQLGFNEKAIACIEKAIGINPNNAIFYYNKGIILAQMGNMVESFACYNEAVKLNPKFENALCNIGTLFLEWGRYDESISYFDKALIMNPNDAKALNGKGMAYGLKNQHALALEAFDKAIALRPEDASFYGNMANSLLAIGEYREAIVFIDKALELNQENNDLRANELHRKGIAFSHLKQNEDAIKYFNAALDINPKFAIAWYDIGAIYYNSGNQQKGIECFRKAKELGYYKAFNVLKQLGIN